jgi:hypothetical protein
MLAQIIVYEEVPCSNRGEAMVKVAQVFCFFFVTPGSSEFKSLHSRVSFFFAIYFLFRFTSITLDSEMSILLI